MIYSIYTDAACKPEANLFAAAYFIKTEDRFIDLGAKAFRGKSIAVAETMAIGLAAHNLLQDVELTNKDEVIIFTDRIDCVSFFESALSDKGYPGSREEAAVWSWNKMRDISQICHCKLKKIRGHRNDKNCNKIADRLAKYSLRACKKR